MFEKMSDGDVMVLVRNTMLMLSQLSQERKIPISTRTDADGYFLVRMGDYKTLRVDKDGRIKYAFEPLGNGSNSRTSEWLSNIPPQSIRFGRTPKEAE